MSLSQANALLRKLPFSSKRQLSVLTKTDLKSSQTPFWPEFEQHITLKAQSRLIVILRRRTKADVLKNYCSRTQPTCRLSSLHSGKKLSLFGNTIQWHS